MVLEGERGDRGVDPGDDKGGLQLAAVGTVVVEDVWGGTGVFAVGGMGWERRDGVDVAAAETGAVERAGDGHFESRYQRCLGKNESGFRELIGACAERGCIPYAGYLGRPRSGTERG